MLVGVVDVESIGRYRASRHQSSGTPLLVVHHVIFAAQQYEEAETHIFQIAEAVLPGSRSLIGASVLNVGVNMKKEADALQANMCGGN